MSETSKVYDDGSMTAPTSAAVVPADPTTQISSIPMQMMTNAQDEEQVSRVETIMLRPVQHVFQDKGGVTSCYQKEYADVVQLVKNFLNTWPGDAVVKSGGGIYHQKAETKNRCAYYE